MTSAGSTEGVIYLDHNATTPVAAEVADAMAPYLREHFANPSSDHVLGRHAWGAVEEAREQVAVLIGAAADEIVFTSGGTESNNLAIFGVAAAAAPTRRRIVTSNVEHPATTSPCGRLEADGWAVARVPVTAAGTLDPNAFAEQLSTDVALATVMLAQNETGALMPIAAIAALARGVGALYVRRGTPLRPMLVGAGQEHGLRPGTENVAGIVGLGAACALAQARLAADRARLRGLRDALWATLSGEIDGLVGHTPLDASLPNTLYVSFPGVLGADVLAHAPGVAASTGSACHSGEHRPSSTLLAMGVAPESALGAVRLSLGRDTTTADIAAAAGMLAAAYRHAVAGRGPQDGPGEGNTSQ